MAEQKARRLRGGATGVCTLYKVKGGGKKQEERTGEELLMALLLSLSADCDSQNQLLSKTTRKRAQSGGDGRERDQGELCRKQCIREEKERRRGMD